MHALFFVIISFDTCSIHDVPTDIYNSTENPYFSGEMMGIQAGKYDSMCIIEHQSTITKTMDVGACHIPLLTVAHAKSPLTLQLCR